MKKYTASSLILCAALLFNGCSDDSTTSPTTPVSKGYFPLTTGSVFVMRKAPLDSANNELTQFAYTDSSIVSSTVQYQGKSAAMTLVYDGATKKLVDTVYFSNENNTSWEYTVPVSLQGLSPVEFPEVWLKRADFNSSVTNWTTFDTTLQNFDVNLSGIPAKASTQIKQVYARSAAQTNVSYGDSTVKATEFVATTTIVGNVTAFGSTLPVSITNVEKLYYAENLGLIKHRREANAITIPGTPINQKITGFNYQLKSAIVR
jgi:hypothetical protein